MNQVLKLASPQLLQRQQLAVSLERNERSGETKKNQVVDLDSALARDCRVIRSLPSESTTSFLSAETDKERPVKMRAGQRAYQERRRNDNET